MPVAVVTGAGVRVGRAIALHLARAGYDLALHANSSALEGVAEAARGVGVDVDVHHADLAEVDGVDDLASSILARHEVVDLVVHNAAAFEATDFARVSLEQWRRMQAINVEAPAFLTQRLLPALELSSQANVVCIVDVMAERPVKKHVHYCVSKAALTMLVKSLAIELAPIRVNGVAPGVAAFPAGYDQQKQEAIEAKIPLGKGSVDDVAAAVVFLAGAGHVTGVVLDVAGGLGVAL
jgi:pteridine reductase